MRTNCGIVSSNVFEDQRKREDDHRVPKRNDLMDFSIDLSRINPNQFISRGKTHRDNSKHDFSLRENCTIVSSNYKRAHHKSVFNYKAEEIIFEKVFSRYIRRASKRWRVTRRVIVSLANTSLEFAPVLKRLEAKYPADVVYRKVYNKVRTLGHSREFFHSHLLFPSSAVSDTSPCLHHRNIFADKQEVINFLTLFAPYVDRVKKRQRISKDIMLDEIKSHELFSVIVHKLLQCRFPNCDINQKIYNKVRTVGYWNRSCHTLY